MADYRMDPSIILSLPMIKGSGTTIYDQSGTGNDSTLIGGLTWDKTNYGGEYSIKFDGSSTQYITNSMTFGAGDYTFNQWVINDHTPIDDQILDYKFGTASTSVFAINYGGIADTIRIIFDRFDNENQSIAIINTALNDNEWHMVTVAFVDGGLTKVYMDGEKIGEGTFTGGLDEIAGTPILKYGIQYHAGSYSKTWDGNMTNIDIWDRELSAEEIKFIYNQTYRA
jgi:hypothetical protein